MRVVKLVPAVEKPPVVVPAPKMSALAAVVLTAPLVADVPVPEAEAPARNCPCLPEQLGSAARVFFRGPR